MTSKSILFRIIFIIAFFIINYLVFSKPSYPQNSIPHLDKIGHIGSFFALTLLIYFAFHLHWKWVLMLMAIYGVSIEVIQSFLPYRSAEVADVIADIAGVALFYVSLLTINFIKYKYPFSRYH